MIVGVSCRFDSRNNSKTGFDEIFRREKRGKLAGISVNNAWTMKVIGCMKLTGIFEKFSEVFKSRELCKTLWECSRTLENFWNTSK